MIPTAKGQLRVNPHTTASVSDDGLVVFHVPSGRIFSSNRVGARLWKSIEQLVPFDRIVTDLSSEYGVPLDAARKDAEGFVAELERNELVERGASA